VDNREREREREREGGLTKTLAPIHKVKTGGKCLEENQTKTADTDPKSRPPPVAWA